MRLTRSYSVGIRDIVSIHAPWEGCDKIAEFISFSSSGFNSRTLGRVRLKVVNIIVFGLCFNSRTLGRVRLRRAWYSAILDVSIHAPWEGCDQRERPRRWTSHRFNSRTLGRVRRGVLLAGMVDVGFQFTHPGKGATSFVAIRVNSCDVSIHAPWEGCDRSIPIVSFWEKCFNSRTLGRVRPLLRVHPSGAELFQFTHPGKGATYQGICLYATHEVSIHAPWEGCDKTNVLTAYRLGCFNSRTLGRVRLVSSARRSLIARFNSRTLGRVRLYRNASDLYRLQVSIHAPWEGCDRAVN